MEDGPDSVEEDPDTRSTSLRDLGATRPEERFNGRPRNVRSRGAVEYCFKGAPLPTIHLA